MRALASFAGSLPLLMSTLLSMATLAACEKRPEPAAEATNPVVPRPTKPGAELLQGTWQVDGFEASSAMNGASAAALQAQASSPEAQAVRITYTGSQVRIQAPGQAIMSSGYDVLDSRLGWVKIKSGNDLVIVTFRDDDHMVIDRSNNAYGAKMKMKRSTGPMPVYAAPSGSLATPFGTAKVVGTNAAGHQIVRIGGN